MCADALTSAASERRCGDDWRLSSQLINEIQSEFPRFRIVAKEGNRLSRWIDVALKLVTWGAQRSYLEHYHTVIGDTLYVPRSWAATDDVGRAIVLRHERVHLRQRRRYGLPLLAFLYLIPFLPLGLAYGRARLEWEAYTETIRATAQYRGIAAAQAESLRQQIVARFTGGAYGWMWPFKRQVQRWFDRVLAQLTQQS
jgi:hypothetical protein